MHYAEFSQFYCVLYGTGKFHLNCHLHEPAQTWLARYRKDVVAFVDSAEEFELN